MRWERMEGAMLDLWRCEEACGIRFYCIAMMFKTLYAYTLSSYMITRIILEVLESKVKVVHMS